MSEGLRLLQAARINRIMQALQDTRDLPSQLKYLARTRVVPAVDSEIMARFVGRVQIADLIADGQKAVVYSSGKLVFETTAVPNLKHGASLTQEELNQLYALSQNSNIQNDMGIFTAWENRIIDGLLLGIRQRMEALIVAMHIDGFSYDRLGIKMSGVTWGMPSDLKVTPSTPWTTHGSATPVADLLTVKLIGSTRYGIDFNRITLSTQAFREMIACTEFQNSARLFLAPNVSFVNLQVANLEAMKGLASNVLGMEIELYDARGWSQDETGVLASTAFQPINKVVLTSTANDNDANVMDFANGIVTESIVSSLVETGGMIGRLASAQRGPVAYATADGDLNPPAITYWGVARGFPRKHVLQSSAVLTVGTLTDAIAVGEPF